MIKLNLLLVLGITLIITAIILVLSQDKEPFTPEQTTFAAELVRYFSSPSSYLSYSRYLIDHGNSSVNLAKIATYKLLTTKGPGLTVDDVLNVM